MKNLWIVFSIIVFLFATAVYAGTNDAWKECKKTDSSVFKQTIEGKTCCIDSNHNTRWVNDKTQECKRPVAQITSPVSGSWQKPPSFTASVKFSADNQLVSCDYKVLSNGVKVFPSGLEWWSISCSDSSITVSASSFGDCKTEGRNTCELQVRASDGLNTLTDSRPFSIDFNPPDAGTYTINGKYTGPVYTNGPLNHEWSGFRDTASGLLAFEIWRAPYNSINCNENDKSGCNWERRSRETSDSAVEGSLPETISQSYMYGWHSVDVAGLMTTEPALIKVIYDTIAPETTAVATSPPGGVEYKFNTWATRDVEIRLSCADNAGGSGCSKTEYCTGVSCVFNTYSAPLTISTEGSTDVKFRSIDNAGKVEATQNKVVKIDTTSPSTTISLSGTLGNNGIYTSDVVVTLTCNDNAGGSGCKELRSCRTTSESCSLTADYSPVTTKTITIANEGTTKVMLYSVDNAGNVEAVKSQSVTIDKTRPDTTIGSGPSGKTLSTYAAFTFSSNEADSTFECRLDTAAFSSCTSQKTYLGLSDGSHTFEVRAIDKAGHIDLTPAQRQWNVDTTSPSTEISLTGALGKDGWYISNVQVSLSCSDSNSGCSTTKYCIDTTNSCILDTYSSNFPVKDEDKRYIRYSSTDNVGNPEAVQSKEIKIDKTKPVTSASATSPPGGIEYKFNTPIKSGVRVSLSCSDIVSGCKEIKYCKESSVCTPVADGSSSTTETLDVTAEGTTYVRYQSVDNAGNVETIGTDQPKVVIIDTTPPVRSKCGTTESVTTSDPTLSLTTTDISPPSTCKYKELLSGQAGVSYDDSSMTTMEITDGISHSKSLSGLGAGVHRYDSKCQDSLANKNQNDCVISVDVCLRSNPTVTITSPVPPTHQAELGQTKSYTIQITNNDQNCGTEPFILSVIGCPSGWTCSISPSIPSIASGGSTPATLSLTSSSSATPDTSYVANVQATNQNNLNYKSTATATYKIINPCTYGLTIKPTSNFDAATKRGSFQGGKNTWELSFKDTSTSGCPAGKIDYKIVSPADISKLYSLSVGCDPESGLYTFSSKPPNGVKLTPNPLQITRGGDIDNAFKVYVRRSGSASCTLTFLTQTGGKIIDPSFTVGGDGSQAPAVSVFDLSGDSTTFHANWQAFYPDDNPFRDMKVKCSLYNQNSCDPDLQDCSNVQGKTCSPYDASQGSAETKEGSCDVSSPAFDYTQQNKVICILYDPASPNLKTRIEPSFTPIDFDFTTADKIVATVGKPVELKIDITNKGEIKDSYRIEISGSNVDISPSTITTGTIDAGGIATTSTIITPLINQNGVVTVKVISMTSGKEIRKDIELSTGLFALPEFGITGFLQIMILAAAVYFLFLRNSGKKRK